MRRNVLTLACAIALSLIGAGEASAATTVRVGIYMDEPLVLLDAKGRPQGLYIDILEGIAPEEGWQLEYVYGSWEECLNRLRGGRIDLMVSIAYSEKRSRVFDFTTETVVDSWGQVYVRPNSPISSLLDLTGKRMSVLREDYYYDTFKSLIGVADVHPQFVETSSYEEALRLLAEGRVDAALVARTFGSYHARNFGIVKSYLMFSPTELRFAAPKGKRKDLLAALDRHLAALKADKRSSYYRSLNVWLEGVQTLVLPRWLNPRWVVGGVAAILLLIGGMNLILRWQVRVKTEALRESLAAQERIEGELRIAHNIQMGSVRRDFPSLPGYDMYAVLQPARAVGGDFYDWFFADQDHLCFVLGDVSGKGVPAALFMAATKTLLHATGVGNPHPKMMLEAANRQVLTGNEACMFVTVFCGVLDVRTGVISYTNAGHNPPVVVRDASRTEYLEGAWSTAIGLVEEAGYEEAEVTLHPGDVLFLYTDGVTEARSERREMFAEERLKDALLGGSAGSAKDLVQSTLEGVTRFGGDAPQADDIAMLAVHRMSETSIRA